MTSNTWFGTIFVVVHLSHTINSQADDIISCGHNENIVYDGPPGDFEWVISYEFIIDDLNLNQIQFQYCAGGGDGIITIEDISNDAISNITCLPNAPCFCTPIVMSAGNYSISFEPGEEFSLVVNCFPIIKCGSVIYEHWEGDGETKTYIFNNNRTNDVTFDSCDSSGFQFVEVWHSLGNHKYDLISNDSCPFGHDCGNCSNREGKTATYYEHFTIQNMVTGDYKIDIRVPGSDINAGTVALNVNCVPLTLKCPAGSNQIGKLNSDIVGCGLSCKDANRFELSTIQDCQRLCNENEDCLSFSWALNTHTPAPTNNPTPTTTEFEPVERRLQIESEGDASVDGQNICTLYNTTVSNGVADYDQVLCELISSIKCGGTSKNTITDFNGDLYDLIVNDSYDQIEVNVCYDMDIDIIVTDNNSVEISPESETVSGVCTAQDNLLLEATTILNVAKGTYLINIHANNKTGISYNMVVNCISTNCNSDDRIIEFAMSGILQVVMALTALWLVSGYLVRFRILYQDQKIMVFSVLGCLLLAFMHGCVRSFILTNLIVPDSDTILGLRCDGLFWHQIFVLQIGQLLMYTYLLSKLHSLNIFTTAMYYCLLLFVSVIILFATALLPWYTIPEIDTGSCDSDLVMCINATPSDGGIYEEYAIFLGVNLLVPFVLLFVFLYQFYQLCTESGCCTMGRNKFTYRILYLGTFLICVQFAEFIYFLIEEETFHAVLFTVYSIVILCSFNICEVNEETGDSLWCCWCCIKDNKYRTVNFQTQQEQESVDQVEDDVIGPLRGPINRVHAHVHVIKQEESIGLI